jgi:aldoxime dehydratase
MESAIPTHLKSLCPRARRIDDSFTPAYPAFVARYQPGLESVAMAYFGVQYEGAADATVSRALDWLAARFADEDGPEFWDRSEGVDSAGFVNIISAAYWSDRSAFDRWFPATRAAWTGEGAEATAFGTFIEVFTPSADSYETLYSSAPHHQEGIGNLATAISGPIVEHSYWGSMRDRIALSQSDEMRGAGEPHLLRDGKRVRVVPHDNLCLIRSGQDWSETEGDETEMYERDIEPVLRAGMAFLSDQGLPIGCFSNRYMTVVPSGDRPSRRSFGLSVWRDIGALEIWAEHHPTHLKIFGAAMKYLGVLGPAARLRLYHEVSVLKHTEQIFEYYNCHPKTGMLNIGC